MATEIEQELPESQHTQQQQNPKATIPSFDLFRFELFSALDELKKIRLKKTKRFVKEFQENVKNIEDNITGLEEIFTDIPSRDENLNEQNVVRLNNKLSVTEVSPKLIKRRA